MSNTNLKDKAYEIIKQKIANCTYQPGQFLIESELMNEVGASRTPIREALNKLEQENLVTIMPKRGVIVNDVTLGLVNEIFEVRLLFEPYIIKNYGRNISKDSLKKQKEVLLSTDLSDDRYAAFIKDDDLHQLIVNSSCNGYIISLMKQIYTQNHRLRIIAGQKIESRLKETTEEHILICNYLLDNNFEEATQAMFEHLSNSKTAAVNAMLSNNTKQISY